MSLIHRIWTFIRAWAATAQIAIGTIAVVLLVAIYVQFAPRARDALSQLDSIAASGEKELSTAIGILDDLDIVLVEVEKSLPHYRGTLGSAMKSARTFDSILGKWNANVASASGIASDSAHILDTFEKQLPIRVPHVNVETKRIVVQLPEFQVESSDFPVSVPTSATPKKKKKEIEYPKGAKVETSTKDFGRVAGKSLGSITYPSGIDPQFGTIEIEYVSGLTINNETHNIKVPKTIIVNKKEIPLDIPDKIEFTHRELMKDEKEVAIKMAGTLRATSTTLLETNKSLAEVQKLLAEDTVESMKATLGTLDGVEKSLEQLRKNRVATIRTELGNQRTALGESRELFGLLKGAIVWVFCLAALIPIGQVISGVSKLRPTSE